MRKYILVLSTLLIVFGSCTKKTTFRLDGNIEMDGYEGKTIFLQANNGYRSLLTLDSTVIRNGKFRFEGEAADTIAARTVSFGRDSGFRTVFVVEPGDIYMHVDNEGVSTVSGTPTNDEHRNYQQRVNDLLTEGAVAIQKSGGEMVTLDDYLAKKALQKEYMNRWQTMVYEYIKINVKNDIGEVEFYNNSAFLPADKVVDLVNNMRPAYAEREEVVRTVNFINAVHNTSEGKKYTDLKLRTLKGDEVSLSDYVAKGKVVLIDFWASWCGPCRAAIPELKKVYDASNKKDFEIVALSLDDNVEAWAKAIEDDKTTWVQLLDSEGFNGQTGMIYGIAYIPQTVLIDKDGMIVARNLEPKDIGFELQKLLP